MLFKVKLACDSFYINLIDKMNNLDTNLKKAIKAIEINIFLLNQDEFVFIRTLPHSLKHEHYKRIYAIYKQVNQLRTVHNAMKTRYNNPK